MNRRFTFFAAGVLLFCAASPLQAQIAGELNDIANPQDSLPGQIAIDESLDAMIVDDLPSEGFGAVLDADFDSFEILSSLVGSFDQVLGSGNSGSSASYSFGGDLPTVDSGETVAKDFKKKKVTGYTYPWSSDWILSVDGVYWLCCQSTAEDHESSEKQDECVQTTTTRTVHLVCTKDHVLGFCSGPKIVDLTTTLTEITCVGDDCIGSESIGGVLSEGQSVVTTDNMTGHVAGSETETYTKPDGNQRGKVRMRSSDDNNPSMSHVAEYDDLPAGTTADNIPLMDQLAGPKEYLAPTDSPLSCF